MSSGKVSSQSPQLTPRSQYQAPTDDFDSEPLNTGNRNRSSLGYSQAPSHDHSRMKSSFVKGSLTPDSADSISVATSAMGSTKRLSKHVLISSQQVCSVGLDDFESLDDSVKEVNELVDAAKEALQECLIATVTVNDVEENILSHEEHDRIVEALEKQEDESLTLVSSYHSESSKDTSSQDTSVSERKLFGDYLYEVGSKSSQSRFPYGSPFELLGELTTLLKDPKIEPSVKLKALRQLAILHPALAHSAVFNSICICRAAKSLEATPEHETLSQLKEAAQKREIKRTVAAFVQRHPQSAAEIDNLSKKLEKQAQTCIGLRPVNKYEDIEGLNKELLAEFYTDLELAIAPAHLVPVMGVELNERINKLSVEHLQGKTIKDVKDEIQRLEQSLVTIKEKIEPKEPVQDQAANAEPSAQPASEATATSGGVDTEKEELKKEATELEVKCKVLKDAVRAYEYAMKVCAMNYSEEEPVDFTNFEQKAVEGLYSEYGAKVLSCEEHYQGRGKALVQWGRVSSQSILTRAHLTYRAEQHISTSQDIDSKPVNLSHLSKIGLKGLCQWDWERNLISAAISEEGSWNNLLEFERRVLNEFGSDKKLSPDQRAVKSSMLRQIQEQKLKVKESLREFIETHGSIQNIELVVSSIRTKAELMTWLQKFQTFNCRRSSKLDLNDLLGKVPKELIATIGQEDLNGFSADFKSKLVHFSVVSSNVNLLKSLINADTDVNTFAPGTGYTFYHIACRIGDPQVVNTLRSKVDLSEPQNCPETILSVFSFYGHADLLNELLKSQAVNPNAISSIGLTSDEQNTPLHLAAQKGHIGVLIILLGQVNINHVATNKKGMTAYHTAAQFGQAEVVRLLNDRFSKEHLFKFYNVSNSSDTPSPSVLAKEKLACVALSKGDVTWRTAYKQTLEAVEEGLPKGVVGTLKKFSGAVAAPSDIGVWIPHPIPREVEKLQELSQWNRNELLFYAVDLKDFALLEMLIEAGANPMWHCHGEASGPLPLHLCFVNSYKPFSKSDTPIKQCGDQLFARHEGSERGTTLLPAHFDPCWHSLTQTHRADLCQLAMEHSLNVADLFTASTVIGRFDGRRDQKTIKDLGQIFYDLLCHYLSQNAGNVKTLIEFINKAEKQENLTVIKGLLLNPRELDVVAAIFTRLQEKSSLDRRVFEECDVDNFEGIPLDILRNQSEAIKGVLLERAITEGNCNAVKRLIQADIDLDKSLPCGLTPIEMSCFCNAQGVFHHLEEVTDFKGKHFNDVKAANLISLAGMGGHRPLFKLLLDTYPVNPNLVVDHAKANGMCVVQSLVMAGQFENLKTILNIVPRKAEMLGEGTLNDAVKFALDRADQRMLTYLVTTFGLTLKNRLIKTSRSESPISLNDYVKRIKESCSSELKKLSERQEKMKHSSQVDKSEKELLDSRVAKNKERLANLQALKPFCETIDTIRKGSAEEISDKTQFKRTLPSLPLDEIMRTKFKPEADAYMWTRLQLQTRAIQERNERMLTLLGDCIPAQLRQAL
ncbi:ankyrin repeat domain-containing protein [Shewanella sp. 202IG2-18]|uniref:ankyrin repeat domain-containing protein n=1 Tax=Parashewanella hymeniacidonis TaxID=2807618 RepID=UPI00196083A0|nr:ankyrin repeat domain-containing protein [Parashewanella hymeniacidonis]MBM7072155.1 ankyrin repeat domain-containing protein [Parashewanella hymeniacidonis]